MVVKKTPNPIDKHVGSRVRMRRMMLGMSQEKLGERLALTFQQVQKYERGVNRIGASRLFDLSRVLDVPIGFFFDDMPPEMGGSQSNRRFSGFQDAQGIVRGQPCRPRLDRLDAGERIVGARRRTRCGGGRGPGWRC